ncbi:MAG: polysaccharide deacetylase family protein [Actinocatenispora sp.]
MSTHPIRTALVAALVVGTVAACNNLSPHDAAGPRRASAAPHGSSAKPSPSPSVDPASVHANELGQVPVLMVHQVERPPSGDYAQTPAQLRATMERLATHDYVPVTAAELVSDQIDIPAGTSPVVLTFDDSSPGQFALRADGTVDPDSAVGIVMAVAKRHPQFRPVGTLYVNQNPFGSKRPVRDLRWLTSHGWEIGNHTATHADLGSLAPAEIQREIGSEQRTISRAMPDYKVTTMALPFGSMPANTALAHRGAWDGTRYTYQGVMLVGANPAPSPFTRAWNPFAIPRIRSWHGRIPADEHYWLPRLLRTRYVSDGNPKVVSFPRGAQARLAARFQTEANPY